MSMLSTAINANRWDLAAHTLIYAAARSIANGEKSDDRKDEPKITPKEKQ